MRKLKVMAIYAHPADPVTDCGGTLALHAANGDDVVIVAITHGARLHPNMFSEEWRKANPDKAKMGASREAVIQVKYDELKRAADILGVKRVILMGEDDNKIVVEPELVHKIAQIIAEERPDILITDYPFDQTHTECHSLITTMIFAALNEVGMYLENLDGKGQYHVKQIFLTKLPTTARGAFWSIMPRNDVYIDITPVIGLKKKAMNCFKSQAYDGDFANKFLESHDGDRGRSAGVNFAEAFVRKGNETHALLPLTEYAMGFDNLTSHRTYSTMNVRDLPAE